MGFWLKLLGGLFAYNLAKKHIATNKDLEKLRQDLGKDKSPFPEPSRVDIQYRVGSYANAEWVTTTSQVMNDPEFYRPYLESMASNSLGQYGVRAVDQNGQLVDMIPGSE